MFQGQFQTTRPMTTAHLAQTMALLTLTSDELQQKIESELASNPALEIVEKDVPHLSSMIPDTEIARFAAFPKS